MPVCSFRVKYVKKANYVKHWQETLSHLYSAIINPVDIGPTLESLESGNYSTITQTWTIFIFKAMCMRQKN